MMVAGFILTLSRSTHQASFRDNTNKQAIQKLLRQTDCRRCDSAKFWWRRRRLFSYYAK